MAVDRRKKSTIMSEKQQKQDAEEMTQKQHSSNITANGKTIYLSNKELLAEVKRCKRKGEMSDKLARMLQMLTSRFAKRGNFVNYCVDKQTTALTKRGWLSYNEILTDDEILSYDVSTKHLVWSRVLDVFVDTYRGDMFHLTTQGLDAFVTPHHKFVSVERGLLPVEDIICDEHIVLMGEPVQTSSSNTLYNDAQIKTVGWAVTEGCYSKKSKHKHSIVISQKEGPKADQIRDCLQTANVSYKEYFRSESNIVTFQCTGAFISQIHQVLAPKRVLSMDFVLSLNQQQRILLIETMVTGDGWTRPNGGMSYTQKCSRHVDAFLVLCTLAGLTTHTTQRIYKTPPNKRNPDGCDSNVYCINIYSEPKKSCKAEWINFHGGKQGAGGRREQKPNLPTVKYDDIIWCPKTQHGTFICRRNGYIYVTGNTYNEDMQAYAVLMLVRTWFAFNPDKSSNPFAFFTQCIYHSFIQYLNHEKRQRNIRDLVMIDQGLNPSYSFEGNERESVRDDEEDYETTYRIPELIKKAAAEEALFNGQEIEGGSSEPVDGTEEIADNEPLLKY